MDVDFLAVALVGTRLYRLARLVSAASRMDVEGADSGADDWGVPAVVCRHHAIYRPYAVAALGRYVSSEWPILMQKPMHYALRLVSGCAGMRVSRR